MIAAPITAALDGLAGVEPVPEEVLQRAQIRFGLDGDSRAVLEALILLERSAELRVVAALGGLHGWPTVEALSLVLGVAPAWAQPSGRLRRHALVELHGDAAGHGLPRIDPTFLPLLAERVPATHPPTRREHDASVELIIARAARSLTAHPAVAVAIVGAPGTGRDTIAAAIAASASVGLRTAQRADLLDASHRRRLTRDARWCGDALAIRDPDPIDTALAEIVAALDAPVLLIRTDAAIEELVLRRDVLVVEAPPIAAERRAAMWIEHAGRLPPLGLGHRFGPGRIEAAGRLARTRALADGRAIDDDDLAWACRTLPTASLGRLAQRLTGSARRDDLILPPATARDLDRAIASARALWSVADRWARDGRGRWNGLAYLFAGPPGTGKTLAARVLGAELGRDVYRVDLSQIVDKYVGETDKHIDRAFAAAEESEIVLFFDEADALFASRTRAEDAHDLYHNQTIAFLLQRIEAHPGLTVLATNQRDRLDVAFNRRMHAVVDFAPPTAVERAALWRRFVPAGTLTSAELDHLAARFTLTGADIRNVALSAELTAAGVGAPLTMASMCVALWSAFRTAGRLVALDEFRPWQDAVARHARGEPT